MIDIKHIDENVIGKEKTCANSDISVFEHFVDVDKLSKRANNIREVIAKKWGGTMLEDLLTPKKSLKQLEKENKRSLKKR